MVLVLGPSPSTFNRAVLPGTLTWSSDPEHCDSLWLEMGLSAFFFLKRLEKHDIGIMLQRRTVFVVPGSAAREEVMDGG